MAKLRTIVALATCVFTASLLAQAPGSLVGSDPIVGNLRYVPAGTFTQGSPAEESCRGADEAAFTHTLSQALAVMETEVSRTMWAALRLQQATLPADPTSTAFGAGLTNPVNSVTWPLAVLYANLLSLQNGFTPCYYKDAGFTNPVTAANYNSGTIYCNFLADGYRLPTEGEWENFCRGGTSSAFSADEPNYTTATCSVCSPTLPLTAFNGLAWWCGNAGGQTRSGGLKNPNPWNLKDIHGNAAEWCWDFYAPYPTAGQTDYRGPTAGTAERVLRSGAFNATATACRSAARAHASVEAVSPQQGFRLVRTLPGAPCTPPSILTPPADVLIAAGQTAVLEVVASGTAPLSYQWYTGELGYVTIPVPGATSPFYITPALTRNRLYKVRVTNACGSQDSAVATVTVEGCEDPVIVRQPIGATVSPGDRALLSVKAEGTGPFEYQWYQGESGNVGAPVSDAAAAYFTTPPLTASASFWVRVRNGCGSADSQTALVAVQACTPPAIVAQPLSQALPPGQSASLVVQAKGTAGLGYQWYLGFSGQTGNPIPEAHDPYYITPPLAETSRYWVRVTNACGDADSATATVTVQPCTPPVFFIQPKPVTVPPGGSATLTVVPRGSEPFEFQWYRGLSGDTANPVPQAISSVLETGPLDVTSSFWVQVANGCGTVNSNAAVVTVQPCASPEVTAQPQNLDILPWRPVLATATVQGSEPLLFQWYQGVSGDTRNPIPGATGTRYQSPVLGGNTAFWLRAANECGQVDSSAATITVQGCTPPIIVTPPQGTTIQPGRQATLAVVADGAATLRYQWRQVVPGGSDLIEGAVAASFTTPPLTVTTEYWCQVANDCGAVESAHATVTVDAGRLLITSQPQALTVQAGNRATLRLAAVDGITKRPTDGCQWYLGESGDTSNPVEGATSSEYTTPELNTTTSYWAQVDGSADSQTAEVDVQSETESRLYAAHLATDANWWSRVTLVNLSDNAVNVAFDAFFGGGQSAYPKGQPVRTILPKSALSLDASEILDPGSDYWLLVKSQKQLAGVIEFGMRNNPTTEVVLPLVDRGCQSMVFPYVVSNVGSWYTGITLINTAEGPVQFVLSAYREDGSPLGAIGPVFLPGGKKYIRLVSSIFPPEAGINPADIRFIKVETTAQENTIVGFELFGIFSAQGGLSGLPHLALPDAKVTSQSASTLNLGEIPNNADWYTGMTFSNLSSVPVTAQAELIDDKSAVLAASSVTLNPMSQMTREVWNLFDGTVHPSASRVRLTSPSPLLGFEVNVARNGMESLDFDGLLGLGGGLTKQAFPLLRASGGWHTTLTLTNLSGGVGTYTLKAYNAVGAELATNSGTIAAGAQVKQDLETLFPGVAASVVWAKLESDQPILGGVTLEHGATHQMGKYAGITIP